MSLKRARPAPETRLGREFFARDPDVVARELLGVTMIVRDGAGARRAVLVETEAYGGADDPASHAHRGPTPRSAIMFGPAGHLYVYLSYGVHWCANVVTGPEGEASAVLLRAAEMSETGERLRGPGNLTRGLAIDGAASGEDCCAEPPGRVSFVAPASWPGAGEIARSRRVGLSRARERESRYYLRESPAVSAHPRANGAGARPGRRR